MVDFITQINEATSGEKPKILGVVALAVSQNGTSHDAVRKSIVRDVSDASQAANFQATL
jgi:hypothetical protein